MVDLEFRVTRMPSEIRKNNSKDLSKRVKREGSLFVVKQKCVLGCHPKVYEQVHLVVCILTSVVFTNDRFGRKHYVLTILLI